MYNKYLKYKLKYHNLKKSLNNQLGGLIVNMPKLCFGTVQTKLEKTLPIAICNNFNHFDCADCYPSNNKCILKENLKKIEREKYWLTWKSDNITIKNITRIIEFLECRYIDLFLIHHYKGSTTDLETLQKAKKLGLITNFGISNYENIEDIRQIKSRFHDIYAIQIQARAPNSEIIGKPKMEKDFVEICNDMGIKIMFYGSTSGFLNNPENLDSNLSFNFVLKLNLYYLNKYIFNKDNCLIVGSISGNSIKLNYDLFNNQEKLNENELLCLEKELEKFRLINMG